MSLAPGSRFADDDCSGADDVGKRTRAAPMVATTSRAGVVMIAAEVYGRGNSLHISGTRSAGSDALHLLLKLALGGECAGMVVAEVASECGPCLNSSALLLMSRCL